MSVARVVTSIFRDALPVRRRGVYPLPSIMTDVRAAVLSGLKEHLESVLSDAWAAELQRGMHDSALLVQAHTEHTVRVAMVQLGSQMQTTGVLSEVHLQRRVLQKMGGMLDNMYEEGGDKLKWHTEITEVLEALPNSVRQALSRDVQRLHQLLRSHQSRAREFVERLLNGAVSQLMTSYKEWRKSQ